MSQDLRSAVNEVVHDSRVNRLIEEAILEDLGMGDITTQAIVPSELIGRGELLAKGSGVLAGIDIAGLVFDFIDHELKFTPFFREGSNIKTGAVLATVEGSIASILKAERTALNILQRMSGIATLTRAFVTAVEGTRAKITDTRKTAPGIRVFDKLGVRIGGGVNHRFGLDDMVLIKDNHIAAAGGIGTAIERCREFLTQHHYMLKVEVETKTLDEVLEAMRHRGIDRIMLDNFSIEEMNKAVDLINHAVEVEASGNVSLENVHLIAATGVDFISIGALTHSPKALDISLNIVQSSVYSHPSA
ncbi:MAG: carboxylating nicotinate-nucleotide diphosphorylase [Ignavibacteria bacterium]|nr:carboxylating nicotinate-nucleotide diphosphorylase [Ignavibacteria bacterium]MBI3766083.1 carboxylating nicotinate-nucleotide diphosphorylase [Ignavibacteriales bacterium]